MSARTAPLLRFGGIALVTLALTASLRAEDVFYSPKITFRIGNGLMMNQGSGGGTLTAFGALNVMAYYYFNGDASLGLGYTSNPPFSSINISSRWYFLGEGTRSRRTTEGGVIERHDNWAFYAGLDLIETAYVVNSTRPGAAISENITGTYSDLNLTLGIDRRLSRHLELTAEANVTALVMTSSNSVIQMGSYLGQIGVSWLW